MFAALLLRDHPPPEAHAALVALARSSSPRVEVVREGLVVVDASGMTRLFGGAREFAAQVHRQAVEQGLAPAMAVAPTRTAAMAVAASRSGVAVIASGHAAGAMAPLPLDVLALVDERFDDEPRAGGGRRGTSASRHYRMAPKPGPARRAAGASTPADASGLRTLHRWGVHTLGALAALPPAAVFERMGGTGLRWQRLARGEDLRPLVSGVEDVRFEQHLALEWPIEGLEPLAFVLARLLEPLSADLERHDRGAVAVHTWLKLVDRTVHHRVLELPAPMREAKVLRTLILLDLESHPPAAGIDEVRVAAEPAPGRIVRGSLLARPLPSPDQISTLLARLAALMGEGRSGSPSLLDTHRPGAFAMVRFSPGEAGEPAGPAPETVRTVPASPVSAYTGPAAVLRRFREPIAATVSIERGRPSRVRAPLPGAQDVATLVCAGPWRSSGAWWEPTAWDHDEWDVVLADGLACRLHRDRASDRWFVEGIWD
jgi:protein ImuB